MNGQSYAPHKIIQVGNSLAVTIPHQFVKEHRLKVGKSAFPRSSDGEITYSVMQPNTTEYHAVDDREFMALLRDVELRYGNVLKKLANLP